MSLIYKILTALGFCPSKEDASGFKPSLHDILSFNPTQLLKPQSFILIILLSTGGSFTYSAIMSFSTRMGNYVPTTLDILTYSLRLIWGASLVLFTLDVYLSNKLSTRHYLESSVFILVSGFSDIKELWNFLDYLSTIKQYPYMTFNWKVALHMNNYFLSYIPMVIAFFLAYLVVRKRPLFEKSTYLLLIGMCLSRILWLMSQYKISLLLSHISPVVLYHITMLVLSVTTLVFALITFMQGYLGKWSKEELHSQGIPWIFRVAIFIYGLRQLVSMSTLFIVPNDILSVFSNTQALFSVVARLSIGFSSIILSMTDWTLSTIFPKYINKNSISKYNYESRARGRACSAV